MDSENRKRPRLEILLIVLAILCATAMVAMTTLCLPYMLEEYSTRNAPTETTTETTLPPTTQPPATEETVPETTEETAPTLPPPEENPYGINDFQYDDRNFLTCLEGDYMVGIDVSRYQYDIDWQSVADFGVEFAMIRVGFRGYESGALALDPYAQANLEGAAEAGLRVGVYFFSQAITPEEAEEEARYILDYIGDYEITMPVVFDWEIPYVEEPRTQDLDPRTLTDCALAFCRVVEEAGYTPMVYFNTLQARHDIYISELTDYPFWLALYTPRMRFPYKVEMWQYTDSGTIPGIEGPVDLDIWMEFDEE